LKNVSIGINIQYVENRINIFSGGIVLEMERTKFVKSSYIGYFETIKILLFKKNPCKICLVRPTCKIACPDYKKYNSLLGHSPLLQRINIWALALVLFVEIPLMIISYF
jgi:hypothetical protein